MYSENLKYVFNFISILKIWPTSWTTHNHSCTVCPMCAHTPNLWKLTHGLQWSTMVERMTHTPDNNYTSKSAVLTQSISSPTVTFWNSPKILQKSTTTLYLQKITNGLIQQKWTGLSSYQETFLSRCPQNGHKVLLPITSGPCWTAVMYI